MRPFFHRFLTNLASCFSRRYLPWHGLAIALTFLIVTTGFDWTYFIASRDVLLQAFFLPAIIAGGILPLTAPFLILGYAKMRRSAKTAHAAYALGQAAALGWIVSSAYKAVTGRVPPVFRGIAPTEDMSRLFQFGFWRGGIFWGWPSSHTTVAFAMAVALIVLFSKNRKVAFFSMLYALYIGFGVSISIHWFSEFIAGAIFGSIVGVVVGKSFERSADDVHLT